MDVDGPTWGMLGSGSTSPFQCEVVNFQGCLTVPYLAEEKLPRTWKDTFDVLAPQDDLQRIA